jgi:ribonuclease T2
MKRVVLLLALCATVAALALAQRAPSLSEHFNAQKRANVPGQFDYYLLVLSWSPSYCVTADFDRDEAQCAPSDGRRHGFVLHGLWPQYEQGYPERCRTRWRPFVPEMVIASLRDIMPSKGLVIHEYRTHGTCSGLQPGSYFALARAFYNQITIPDRYRNPFEAQYITPGDLMRDFLRANPALKPDMIEITCTAEGNRLSEVRICMTKDGRPRRCGQMRAGRSQCRVGQMKLPPVRSRRDDRSEPPRGQDLPSPRIIERPRAL